MSEKAEVIPFNEQEIKVYDEFEAQLTELEKWNSTAVFNYEDPKGNKEARSHVYKLRKTKSAVDQARKDAGRDALEYKRKVDAKGNEIIAKVESMIEVHQKPLDEIEQRENDRIAAHQANMDILQGILDTDFSQDASGPLCRGLDNLLSLEPDESFEEFTAPALSIWKKAKEKLENAIKTREKYEADQRELERLRAEQAEREQKEREERIAREAAERARQAAERARQEAEAKAKREREEAEQKAQAEREAAARREAEAKAAQEAAEKARIEAEAHAKREAEEAEKRRLADIAAAEQRAKEETEAAKQAEEAAARKREADKKHHAKINNEALEDFVAGGLSQIQAKKAVTLLAQRKIRHIEIKY